MQNFLARFSVGLIEDSQHFLAGSGACRNGLFLRKAFTLTTHQVNLEIECNYGFTFINILSAIPTVSNQNLFFYLKIVFLFLPELKRNLSLRKVKKDMKLKKEKISW